MGSKDLVKGKMLQFDTNKANSSMKAPTSCRKFLDAITFLMEFLIGPKHP